MRTVSTLAVFAACLCLVLGMKAQGPANADPVSTAARQIVARQAEHLIAAAEAMPAEKYSFRPTPQQMSFGELVLHVARSNLFLCGQIGGQSGQMPSGLTSGSPKESLVAALRDSFHFCQQALAGLRDSRLGESVRLFGGRTGSRAEALLALTNDLADHYAQAAMYLRLNGLLPPTARRPTTEAPPKPEKL